MIKNHRLLVSRLIILLLVLMPLFGCSTLDAVKDAAGIKNPDVSISGMRVTGLSLEGAELEFALNVDNPNPVAINLAGFDYALLINGQQFLQGEQRSQVKIPARNANEVKVPVAFKFAELAKLSQGLLDKDKLNYEIKTDALVDLPVLGVKKFPVSDSGDLPIPKVPNISLAGIKIDQLGLTGAKLGLQLNVDNPNNFGLDIRQLVYNLTVNGQQWAQSNLGETISLDKKGNSQLNIPISLNFLEMGSALYKVLTQSQPLDYQLNGDMKLDTSLPLLKDISAPFNKAGTVNTKR